MQQVKNSVLKLMLAAASIFILNVPGSTVTAEASPEAGAMSSSHPDYPGRSVLRGRLYDVTTRSVQLGVQAFYKVFERWPQSWGEVRQSGLWQSPLVGFQLQPVDPDDPSLDFHSDLYYEAPSASVTNGRIHQMAGLSGLQVSHLDIVVSYTLPETLRGFEQSMDMEVEKYLGDVNWLKFIALRQASRINIEEFHSIHGRYPASGSEFLRSGLGPIDLNSVNPMTGELFHFDGREFDFYYELSADGQSFVFYHTEEGGSRAEQEWYP